MIINTQVIKNKIMGISQFVLYAVIYLVISSSLAEANNGAKELKQKDINPPSRQAYGDYLAGRHAAFDNDLHAAVEYHQKALALDPENIMILKKAFAIFIADSRYDLALEVAQKHKNLQVSDSMVQMFLFLEQVKLKNYDASLSRLDNLSDAGIYGLFKPLFRAWVLLAQGKKYLAEAEMTHLLENNNFKNFRQFHAGLFYDYIGKTELAEKMYAQSLVVPGAISLRTIEAYGILLRRLGRPDDARQLYKNYLETAPENAALQGARARLDGGVIEEAFLKSETDAIAEVFFAAANFLMQDNIHMSAILYLRYAMYLKKDFYSANYLLGQIFDTNKYYAGAVKNFGVIPKSHYLFYQAQLHMVWILEKTGKLDEAIGSLKKLRAHFPERKEILGILGDIYRMHGRLGESAKAYTKYIDSFKKPEEKNWSVYYARGIVYEQAKQWGLAEADLQKALQLHPDQPQVMNYLAYSWVDRGINFEKARKMLELAVVLRPYDGYIIDSLGWALYHIGDMPKAVEYLEKAVLFQASDWAINDHLGDAYWAVGRRNEARFQWRHALSLKPDTNAIPKIKAKIEGQNLKLIFKDSRH